MADDLLHELKKLGYKTKPIGVRDPRPDEGILVTGAFTQAGTDGKLRLAAVGPSATGGAMQVVVTTTNLYHTAKPLYEIVSKDAGGDSSGAIRLNPEVAVVKFSWPNNPADKDVKKTAEQIAAELERLSLQAEAEGPSGPNDPLNKFSKP